MLNLLHVSDNDTLLKTLFSFKDTLKALDDFKNKQPVMLFDM